MYIFYVIIYVIIFRVLPFMLSFDVIIFHSQQILSFICYHFSLYIFCVIIYCYHDIYIMNNDNIQAFKIDNIYSMKNDNILYTWKW